jgi:NAD(P)-dependent dehydrogenase (short-subunit alcohol dehydrogenase family)
MNREPQRIRAAIKRNGIAATSRRAASHGSRAMEPRGSRFAHFACLVAGGTGALGRAVCLEFLGEGAKVVTTYRTHAEFDALRRSAGAAAERLEGRQIDVTDEVVTRELVEAVVGRHGRLDALVNAVGGYTGGGRLWDVEPKALERMLALNLRSGYALARAVLPPMLSAGRGAIVNVAARAALEPQAGAAAYAASKAAALALMGSLAAETRGTGVRVNSVLPSVIDTEANRASMPKADFSQWPKPEQIARVISFLCSDDAEVVHGAAIPVYGGR